MVKSTKGAVGFTTEALKRLSETYTQYRSRYESEQSKIVSEVAEVVGMFGGILKHA